MTDDRPFRPALISGAMILAGAAAVMTAWGLGALAKPKDFDARLGALEATVRTSERLASSPGDSGAYRQGAVCAGLGGDNVERVRQALEASASAEGLSVTRITLGQASDISGRLAPLALRIEAEGAYAQLTSYLDRLGRGAPQIFVDTADMSARGALVRLSLNAKVFCWTGS